MKEMELIPPFRAGEALTIQRNVNGKNVLMVAEVRNPCSLGPQKMILNASLKTWGESSYADGRVARQLASIERLLAERDEILRLAIEVGANKIVDLLDVPAKPEQLSNPDGSGYQV